jgi:RNA polymerase sigma-70 factor (ECF subfamily)
MVIRDSDAAKLAGGAAVPVPQGPRVVAERKPFEGLYREHFAFVWRSLRRLGVWPSNLDDAAQEVFVVVHRRYADFQPGTSEKAWLFAISQRVASDQRRTRRRKGGLSPLSDTMASDAPDAFDAAVRSEAQDVVLAFLDTLDEDQRAAFILSDLEQLTAKEISDTVGANINTVYYRVAAARKQFASFVEKRKLSPKDRSP